MALIRVAFVVVLGLAALVGDAVAWYSPDQGRFVQRDPLGYIDGMNLYRYGKSNPIKYGDPTGQFVCGDVVPGSPEWEISNPFEKQVHKRVCFDEDLYQRLLDDCDASWDSWIEFFGDAYRECRRRCESFYRRCMGTLDPWDPENLSREKFCDVIRDTCQDMCRATVGAAYYGAKGGKLNCVETAPSRAITYVEPSEECPPGTEDRGVKPITVED